MELYVIAGGHNDSLKRWENDLSAQFFKVYKNGVPLIQDGQQVYRRLLVAPVQLYKICFAKEELENVLPLVCPSNYIENRYPFINKSLKWIRKFIGLKEAPTPKFEHPLLQPNQIDKAVFVQPVGIKDDQMDNNGNESI